MAAKIVLSKLQSPRHIVSINRAYRIRVIHHRCYSSKHMNHLNLPYIRNHTRSFTNNPREEDPLISEEDFDDKIDGRAYPIALSSLLGGIGMGVILPILPQLANEIGINAMQYGLVFSVTGFARLITNIPAGVLSDKLGRKSTLVGGPIINGLGILILAQSQSLYSMMSSQFIGGTGGSMQMAGAQAYLSDISTVRNRARTLAPMAIGMSAGMVLGPFIGGVLCDYYESVRIPFYFVSGAMGLVAFNNWYSLSETLDKKDRKDKSRNMKAIFSKMFAEWKYLVKDISHMSCIAVHTSNVFVQAGAIFILMPLYATNELGISATQIGSIFAMMSVVNIFGAPMFAKVSDKFGRKKVIIPAVCIISAALPLLPNVSNINELFYLMFVYSIGTTLLSTAPTAYIADIHSGDKEREGRRSQALAMLRSGGDIGLMVGTGLLGSLTHIGGYQFSMCTASVVLIGSGINFAIRAKETVNPG